MESSSVDIMNVSFSSSYFNQTTSNTSTNELSQSEGKDIGNRYLIILLSFISMAGITGNTMVIVAVRSVPKLNTTINIMLSSLAIADLLVSVVVMPLNMVQLIVDRWPLGHVWCTIFIFQDVCSCTSSILHLCAIAMDRYCGIAKPIKTNHLRTKTTVRLRIFIVWAISITIASPILVFAVLDPSSMYIDNKCLLNNWNFQIYGSFAAFYVPFTVMTITFLLTTRKLNDRNKPSRHTSPTAFKKAGQLRDENFNVNLSNGKEYCTQYNDRKAPVLYLNRKRGTQICADLSSSTSGNNNLPESHWDMQLESNHKHTIEERKKLIGRKLSNGTNYSAISPIIRLHPFKGPPEQPLIKLSAQRKPLKRRTTNIAEFFAKRKFERRERLLNKQHKREKKAVNVLGLVFAAFVVCWAPFFIMNTASAICLLIGTACIDAPIAMEVVVWLGYCASIVNPIIYTIINKEFQLAFKHMLMCKLWKASTIRSQGSSIMSASKKVNGNEKSLVNLKHRV